MQKMDTQEFINQLVSKLDLQPLTFEGGLFNETYHASEGMAPTTLPTRYHAPHVYGSAIYYLLTGETDSFSAMHRLLTDEIYHFYLGDTVEMLLLYPDRSSQVVILGQDILGGQKVQFVVPAGVWQGSHLQAGGEYALLGTTMAPGFDAEDFTAGQRADLLKAYPAESGLICRLTRSS